MNSGIQFIVSFAFLTFAHADIDSEIKAAEAKRNQAILSQIKTTAAMVNVKIQYSCKTNQGLPKPAEIEELIKEERVYKYEVKVTNLSYDTKSQNCIGQITVKHPRYPTVQTFALPLPKIK
jgi:hypothetical protein